MIALALKEVTAMIALDGSWPRNVDIIRGITIQIVVAIFASAFLTSAMIVLFVSVDASRTLTAAELWRIGLSVSTIPPTLIGLLIASRMRQSLEDLRMTHEELVNLAWMDELTGLPNWRGFDAAAAKAFAEARRLGQPISALMCDIDTFKGLNDKYGHEAGDVALRNVAQMIQESIGDRTAVLGRQGGGEFVILLPSVELEEAARIAEGLREVCEARALVQLDRAAKFTISVGAGTEASSTSELRAVLRRADAALYRAKRAGGNQVVPAPTPFVQRRNRGLECLSLSHSPLHRASTCADALAAPESVPQALDVSCAGPPQASAATAVSTPADERGENRNLPASPNALHQAPLPPPRRRPHRSPCR